MLDLSTKSSSHRMRKKERKKVSFQFIAGDSSVIHSSLSDLEVQGLPLMLVLAISSLKSGEVQRRSIAAAPRDSSNIAQGSDHIPLAACDSFDRESCFGMYHCRCCRCCRWKCTTVPPLPWRLSMPRTPIRRDVSAGIFVLARLYSSKGLPPGPQ